MIWPSFWAGVVIGAFGMVGFMSLFVLVFVNKITVTND